MSALAIPLDGAATTQLPVHNYFDPAIAAQEAARLFADAPTYLGHRLMVPNPDDYHTLGWLDDARMLRNVEGRLRVVSNVCRHRQALIYRGRGNGRTISCNLHGWTYDGKGELIGAPHFADPPCLALTQTPITEWHGLAFDARRDVAHDLASLGVAHHIDFSGFAWHSSHRTDYDFNWKTFIEVYAEDYHVDPFHPGLGNFVDCSDLRWEWGEHYHVQTVGIKNRLARAGSKVYGQWQQQVLHSHAGRMPEFGAIWLVYYPNIMIECYPHCIVISCVIPRGAERCTVSTEFYYPQEIVWFEPEFIAAEQAAYFETAKEDDEICLRMHAGRKALWLAGQNETGPYQDPTELGMQHFHRWYRQHMGAH